MKFSIVTISYIAYVYYMLSVVWILGSFYFTWIFKGEILQTPILRTVLLILFPIAVAYHFYWSFKIDDIQRKKYLPVYKKCKYQGSYRLAALIWWFEIFKNSHPEDKLYSTYIFHLRISGIVLLSNLLALGFVSM